jgi:hypothetical protein
LLTTTTSLKISRRKKIINVIEDQLRTVNKEPAGESVSKLQFFLSQTELLNIDSILPLILLPNVEEMH